MPVVVQCYHCNAILELDDGFRGGVCRCSACGSLLQVPRGDDASPPSRKARPAMPPPPTAPVSPLQNATSSRLDVGLSRGQFELPSSPIAAQDIGVSSGLRRVHRTRPIAATSRLRPVESAPAAETGAQTAPATPAAPAAPAASASDAASRARSRRLMWAAVILLLLAVSVLGSMFIYYLYFYPET